MTDTTELYRCVRGTRCPGRERVTERAGGGCECDCHGGGLDAPCSEPGGCGHLHTSTKRWVGAAITADRGLCRSCTSTVEQAIREMPMDYVELETLIGRHGSAELAEQVTVTAELKVPINLTIESIQVAICNETQLWVELVAEQMGMTWDTQDAARSRPGVTLQRACKILTNTVPTLLTLPDQDIRWSLTSDWEQRDGLAGGLELLWLHDLVRSVAGRSALVHKLPAPCPKCDRVALIRPNGSSTVQCEFCHELWSEKDYERLCLVLASDQRLLIADCDACDQDGQLPDHSLCQHQATVAA